MPIIKFTDEKEPVGIIKPTKEQEREINRQRKIEEFKQKITLLKARLFNKRISPDDTRTLQAHRDGQGELRDYYISNLYLQKGISYSVVTPILEDEENGRYVYRGLVTGADNATGVIESNVPISEIVASPSGNVKLQEMLSEENAMEVCKQYWRKIGEKDEPLAGHSLYWGKPDFVLGTILKGKKGQFTITPEIQQDIEKMLEEERAELKKEESMRVKGAVQLDLGGGLVVAEQDCWMEPGNQIKFAGINNDALYYIYEPDKPVKTYDGKYVYIGTTQIGKSSVSKQTSNMPIQLVSPFIYDNVVLWTERKSLIQYFMEDKFKGLNFELATAFTNGNLKSLQKSETPLFIGGISLDEDGKCIRVKETPNSVTTAIEQYLSARENDEPQVIDFIAEQE